MAIESIESTIDLTPNKDEQDLPIQKKQPDQVANKNDTDNLDINIVDDTPEQDRNRQRRAPGTKSAIPEDDEIGQYTKGVQDRLKQMKWEYHEERRAKEQWQREHEAALGFAKKVHDENQKLRKLMEGGHESMLKANKSSVENELSALQASLTAAIESGDAAKSALLQRQIATAAARLVSVEQTQPIKFEQPDPQEQQQDQRQQQRQPQVTVTDSMQDWMDDNPWFNGRDSQAKRMTAYAFGIHDDLKQQGVRLESPAYFKAINEEIRQRFPEYFDQNGNNGNNNENDAGATRSQPQRRTVQSASRLNGAGNSNDARQKNKVTLTQSEVAVAKRLGVSPEQYAREKLRLEQN